MIELFEHNGGLYKVIRKITISQLQTKDNKINSELFNAWKYHLNADKVLKTQTHFLFCQTIEDLDWEEIPKPTEPSETPEPIGPGL